MNHNLTRAQKSNLTKLADYLEKLPEDYAHFEMRYYIEGGDEEGDKGSSIYATYARKNGGVDQHGCGTVACAVGHGPAAGILFRPQELLQNSYFDEEKHERIRVKEPNWDNYSYRFAPKDDPLWTWCFGSDWSYRDNHHWGAAARIRFILAGRDLPDDYDRYADPTDEHVEAYKSFRKQAVQVAITWEDDRVVQVELAT